MTRNNAKKLGKPKLLAQVKAELGVDLPNDLTVDKILDYMQEQGLLDVEDVEGAADAEVDTDFVDALEGVTHVKLLVHEDADLGRNYVTASDEHGNAFQIMKGAEVTVPIGVYHSLNDAKATVFDSKTDDTGQLIMRPVSRHTHPFSVIGFIKKKGK
jgi:hypothetical protein